MIVKPSRRFVATSDPHSMTCDLVPQRVCGRGGQGDRQEDLGADQEQEQVAELRLHQVLRGHRGHHPR